MNARFIAIIAVIIIGLSGLLFFTREDSGDSGSEDGGSSAQATNHTVGAGNKNVTLVEYGDLQCPACRAFLPIVNQIKADYGDDITFQFRHFPLVQIHNNAFIAARAAEAAGIQGKFFEMHDILYERQDSWARITPDPTDTFVIYAEELELDTEKFRADMQTQVVSDSINADLAVGRDLGLNSTPSFLLNGKKIENPQTIEEFKALIDEEIANSSS